MFFLFFKNLYLVYISNPILAIMQSIINNFEVIKLFSIAQYRNIPNRYEP